MRWGRVSACGRSSPVPRNLQDGISLEDLTGAGSSPASVSHLITWTTEAVPCTGRGTLGAVKLALTRGEGSGVSSKTRKMA